MMSNITAVSSASSPPPVNTELPSKAGSSEDVARPTRTYDPPQPPGTDLTTAGSRPAQTAAPTTKAQDAKAKDTKTQDEKAQDARTLTIAVDELNQRFDESRIGLQFNVDEKSEQIVVKVMDIEKNEVIRQIPPKELLDLAAFLKEKADEEAQQMERASLVERGLTPKAGAQEGLLLNTKA